jgi:hypothetical protein
MWLGVLGPLDVRHEDAVIAVPAAKQRIVLGTLLIHANQVVSFEQFVEAVWDGSPPDGARVTLRNYEKRLRRILGPAVGQRIRTRDTLPFIEPPHAACAEGRGRRGTTAPRVGCAALVLAACERCVRRLVHDLPQGLALEGPAATSVASTAACEPACVKTGSATST